MSVTAAGPAHGLAHPTPSDRRHERDRGRATDRRGVRPGGGAGRAALIPYVVAGYPDAETSFRVALAAADAGADLLEIGLPYSDPLADGATLQRASQVALAAGATFDGSIALIERIAAARPELPLVPMAYANQVIGGGDGVDDRPAPGRRRRERGDRRRPHARRGRLRSRRSPGRPASPSSTSSRRRPNPTVGRGSRPGPGASCTASRSSASPAPGRRCPGPSVGSSGRSAR